MGGNSPTQHDLCDAVGARATQFEHAVQPRGRARRPRPVADMRGDMTSVGAALVFSKAQGITDYLLIPPDVYSARLRLL
jgi:hypothetical protein